MTSGKLDQSLDEIMSGQRRASGRNGNRGTRMVRRSTNPAPVGGVQKTVKARAATSKQAPLKGVTGSGESKVVVSNLPKDVDEKQIKEYFIKSVGIVKRVDLSYGPNSVSRGIATVVFRDADGATKAFNNLNGLLVDGKPIKIEIVVSAAAAALIPQPKTLTERISQPKPQPKSAASSKKKDTAAARDGGSGATRGARKGRGKPKSARPAKKTAEELDSEMADYFEAGVQNDGANGAAPAPANGNGDATMEEDEIL